MSNLPCSKACQLRSGLLVAVGFAADEGSLPECLQVVSRADDGEVMAVQHAEFPTFGVPFHPESILTPDGRAMIENFLAIATK